jgi:hypothetical protein
MLRRSVGRKLPSVFFWRPFQTGMALLAAPYYPIAKHI